MIGAQNDGLKLELKNLIITECFKEITANEVKDDEELFSGSCKLELDSMDALQISMALKREYNIELNDSKILRKVMFSINTLANYVEENKQ